MRLNCKSIASWPWASIAAWIAIAVTIGIASWQIRTAKFVSGVDVLLRMEDEFQGEKMLIERKSAASVLLKKPNSTPEDMDDLLDFFESLGLLTRRGALDKEMVWNNFFYWAHRYWIAAEDYIAEKQKKDPTEWENFTKLEKDLIKIEKKHGSTYNLKLTKNSPDIKTFLEEECSPVGTKKDKQ